jgi:hypothetical protein
LLTSSSLLLMEEQVGDCGVDWHCSATLKDIRARTPRGKPTLKSTNIQRVWSRDPISFLQFCLFWCPNFSARRRSALVLDPNLSALSSLNQWVPPSVRWGIRLLPRQFSLQGQRISRSSSPPPQRTSLFVRCLSHIAQPFCRRSVQPPGYLSE